METDNTRTHFRLGIMIMGLGVGLNQQNTHLSSSLQNNCNRLHKCFLLLIFCSELANPSLSGGKIFLHVTLGY